MSNISTVRPVTARSAYPSRGSEHPYNLQRALERFEQGYLHNILVLAEWDIVKASEMLGIRPKTLCAKMKRYDLQRKAGYAKHKV